MRSDQFYWDFDGSCFAIIRVSRFVFENSNYNITALQLGEIIQLCLELGRNLLKVRKQVSELQLWVALHLKPALQPTRHNNFNPNGKGLYTTGPAGIYLEMQLPIVFQSWELYRVCNIQLLDLPENCNDLNNFHCFKKWESQGSCCYHKLSGLVALASERFCPLQITFANHQQGKKLVQMKSSKYNKKL